MSLKTVSPNLKLEGFSFFFSFSPLSLCNYISERKYRKCFFLMSKLINSRDETVSLWATDLADFHKATCGRATLTSWGPSLQSYGFPVSSSCPSQLAWILLPDKSPEQWLGIQPGHSSRTCNSAR